VLPLGHAICIAAGAAVAGVWLAALGTFWLWSPSCAPHPVGRRLRHL